MLGCFALSTNTVNGFDLDLRFFPLLMGSLYGGYPAAIILSIEYIILRIPMLADRIETTGFIIFFMLFIPLILLTIRPFQLARMKHKFGIAFMLMGFCGIYYGLLYISYIGIIRSRPNRPRHIGSARRWAALLPCYGAHAVHHQQRA